MKFGGEFHLREILIDASIVETVAEVGTEFTEGGIIFGKGYSVDSLSRAQVQEVFSAYNGASAYGEATIQYYDAFLRHIE